LEVTPTTVNLDIQDSVTLKVIPLNADGALVCCVPVIFGVADPSVVTVSAGGTVTSVNPGTTSLSVEAGGVSKQVPVAVVAHPAGIAVTPDSVRLEIGETATLTVKVTDKAGSPMLPPNLQFTSGNDSVARVSSHGLVTAVSQGATVILTKVGLLVDSTKVEVTAAAASIVVTPDSMMLAPGETRSFTIEVYDRMGRLMADPDVDIVSSDPKVAWVWATAHVVQAADTGETLITVTAGAIEEIMVVRVDPSRVSDRIAVPSGPFDCAISGTGVAAVAMVRTNALQFVDVPTRALLGGGVTVGGQPVRVAFSPDGRTAYASSQSSDDVRVVDVTTRMVLHAMLVAGGPVPILVSADGQTLFVSTNNGHLKSFDLGSGILTGDLWHYMEAHYMTSNEDRTLLYLAGRDSRQVMEVDPATMTSVRVFPTGGRAQGVAVSPDGSRLFVAIETGAVGLEIWDLVAGTRLQQVPLEGGALGVALNGDASRVYVTVPDNGVVLGVDAATGTVIDRVFTGGEPRAVCYDATSSTFMVANYSGSLDFFQ